MVNLKFLERLFSELLSENGYSLDFSESWWTVYSEKHRCFFSMNIEMDSNDGSGIILIHGGHRPEGTLKESTLEMSKYGRRWLEPVLFETNGELEKIILEKKKETYNYLFDWFFGVSWKCSVLNKLGWCLNQGLFDSVDEFSWGGTFEQVVLYKNNFGLLSIFRDIDSRQPAIIASIRELDSEYDQAFKDDSVNIKLVLKLLNEKLKVPTISKLEIWNSRFTKSNQDEVLENLSALLKRSSSELFDKKLLQSARKERDRIKSKEDF